MKKLFPLLVLLVSAAAWSEMAVTDAKGNITAIQTAGEYIPVQIGLRIPVKGWSPIRSLSDATDVRMTRDGDTIYWQGNVEVESGKLFGYVQTLEERDGSIFLHWDVTAQAVANIEGVFLWLDVPIELFSGGACELLAGDVPTASASFPVTKPDQRHFVRANSDRILMAGPDGRIRLEAALDRPLNVVVQDTREWSGSVYTAFPQIAGVLEAGQTASLDLELKLTAEPDETPANLSLDARRTRFRLHGFGGNYCFGIESPVTQYTLANLNVAWARTEMTPMEWEPENDDADPAHMNWEAYESRDRPGSNLRREFELARQIQDKGIPYVISIWNLPEWLYRDPGKGIQAHHREVPPELWDELLECLGSYLLYAKRQYGVEPDLFSFNEPDYGVKVYFSPEGHREAIKSIGAYFGKLGLKTKMLLADTAAPRNTHTYGIPASQDPEAMKYVGAVAFHSWGGASPEQYKAWGDFAERLGLPLLVAELGVDAGAWRTRSYDSFQYALREVQMYQELILHARPQGTMQWEFTSDYSIVKEIRGADGTVTLEPTVRFHFVRHFCNLTPQDSEALATESDHPKVLFTAFRKATEDGEKWALHISNHGAARKVRVSGLPASLTSLTRTVTSETLSFGQSGPISPVTGEFELDLPALSLTTLTSP
ncbi:MAG: hypothetical protein KBI47_04615 [Armatimonadetes bacterium]|nr:hypothetical protein [Armatimonadota bacterium]MDI9586191.1 hypothetical protein [Acidobacteriota bacterium]